jgi:tetratricopeptide (TPR) repeat protein
MADIFISYTSNDREWAFWIAKELDTLGHVPHVHEWEIKGSDDIYGWMEQHLDAADHVLFVISNDYLKAPYSTLERHAALWQAAKRRPGFVLLVLVKSCTLPVLSDHLRHCELFNTSEDAARLRFKEFMSHPGPPTDVAFPGKLFAVSNIPIRMPTHFMGRDDALDAIETAFKRNEGRVAVTALHGLRGVGKTTLAVAYADRHRGNYRVTWWIRAETEAGMRADLVALGIRLGWVRQDEKEGPALGASMERLRHEGEGMLLIFDNAIRAETLKPYLPRGGGARVLVTTSNAHGYHAVAAPIKIRVWPKEIGADYLVACTGRQSEHFAAESLSETLGGLPLAHEQAAAYCDRLHVSLSEYSKRFDAATVKFLDDKKSAATEYHPEHHDRLTVAGTFRLAIEEAAKLHPAAEPLIEYAAQLAPEPIPLFLFSEAREKLDEPLATDLADDGLEEAVAALRTFALVDRETIVDERDASIATEVIRLHRLVREVAAARLEGEVQDQLRGVLAAALAAVYPTIRVWRTPKSWPRCALLTPHLLSICSREMDATANSEYVRLLNRAGEYFQGLAAYSESQPLYERAVAISEELFGPEHSDTATSLNNLAWVFYDQAELERAQPLFERALAIREKVLGPEHPDTASSLNDLGWLLYQRGDSAMARPLHERALAIREKLRGPEHSETAESLNNLARLLRVQGDLPKARALNERALVIFEKVLGPEHPETAACLNSLAMLLIDESDLDGARPLLERALAIREKGLGPKHPETAGSLNNLAWVFYDQGDLERARPLFERALAIREKVFGPEHPETAVGLRNLAVLLQAQGDLASARSLFERAIATAEKVLGSEDTNTNRWRCDFSRLLLASGNAADALRCSEMALAGHEKSLGENNPRTKDAARATADALAVLGREEEAAALRARYQI